MAARGSLTRRREKNKRDTWAVVGRVARIHGRNFCYSRKESEDGCTRELSFSFSLSPGYDSIVSRAERRRK